MDHKEYAPIHSTFATTSRSKLRSPRSASREPDVRSSIAYRGGTRALTASHSGIHKNPASPLTIKGSRQPCVLAIPIERAAKGALKQLTAAVQTGDTDLRQHAMRVLVVIGADAKPAVPALAEALTAKEKSVRLIAARTLGQLGASAAEALPALQRAMEDVDVDVSLAAAEAVLAITAKSK